MVLAIIILYKCIIEESVIHFHYGSNLISIMTCNTYREKIWLRAILWRSSKMGLMRKGTGILAIHLCVYIINVHVYTWSSGKFSNTLICFWTQNAYFDWNPSVAFPRANIYARAEQQYDSRVNRRRIDF